MILGIAYTMLLGPTVPVGAQENAASSNVLSAPAWSYDPETAPHPSDVTARAAMEGVSAEEATRRFHVEDAAAVLSGQVQADYPETFAGVWETSEPFGIVVAFTSDAAMNEEKLRASFQFPDDLHTVSAATSFATLTALEQRMAEERSAIQAGSPQASMPSSLVATGGRYDLGIDLQGGHVVVIAPDLTEQARSDFQARYSPSLVSFEVHALSQPTSCRQPSCYPAMLGAIELDHPGGTEYCSSAFSATADGGDSMLSAGHCYTTDSGTTQRANGGHFYGYVNRYVLAGHVDAELDYNYSGGAFQPSSKFIVTDEPNPRSLASYQTYANMVVGGYVGKTGIHTGTTRGYITSKSFSPWWVSSGSEFLTASNCNGPGDSGGAVFKDNTAYGIVSGTTGLGDSCRDVNGNWTTASDRGPLVFGSIQAVQTQLNTTLLYNHDIPPVPSFYQPQCNLTLSCTFNGYPSVDYDGSVANWTWDFGDNTSGSGPYVTHSYPLPGSKTVTLTVCDNDGVCRSTSQSLLVD